MDFPEKAIIGIIGDASAIVGKLKTRNGTRVIGPRDALDLSPTGLIILVHALDLYDRRERQQAAMQLAEARRAGQTILLISNDEELLESTSDELWWNDLRGMPAVVLQSYRKHVAAQLRQAGEGRAAAIAPSMRRGDGRASIRSIELLGAGGNPTVVWSSGEAVTIRVTVQYQAPVDNPVIGMLIRTRVGLNVYGTNTELEQLPFGPCATGETAVITFAFACELCPGEYTLTIASHDPDGVWHEWLEDAVAVSVTDSRYTAGVANLRARVSVTKRV
jgi:Wzt C-terminal domain